MSKSVAEITTTGSAASFLGSGMHRAMSNSNRTNSKFGCSGCGAVMPKYEGRYLANCPACGTPIVRRTSERIHEVGHGSRVACPVSGQTGTVSQVHGPMVEVRWDSGRVEIREGLFLDPVTEAPIRTIKTPKSGAPVQRKQTGTVPRIKPVRNIGEVSAYDPLGIGRGPLVSYRGGDPYILLNGTTPQEADAYRGTFLEFITIPEANSATPCHALTMFKDGQVKGSVRMDNPNLLEAASGFLRDVFGAVEAPVAMQELKVALRAARQTG